MQKAYLTVFLILNSQAIFGKCHFRSIASVSSLKESYSKLMKRVKK